MDNKRIAELQGKIEAANKVRPVTVSFTAELSECLGEIKHLRDVAAALADDLARYLGSTVPQTMKRAEEQVKQGQP